MTADEQKLHDYLDEQGIYEGKPEMQDIVINSYYVDCEQSNDDEWEEKVRFVNQYFELFQEYVMEEWANQGIQDYYERVNEHGLDGIDDDIPEINTEYHQVIDLKAAAETTEPYKNLPVALASDHVVRLSVMTGPYFWHSHPNSEEIFIVLEGTLIIELDDQTVELQPNQLFTIKRDTPHRTRPMGERSVNLTISSGYTQTIPLDERE
jgi:mannose-6-phosphate isomerase-like protein (cupin superfamily)